MNPNTTVEKKPPMNPSQVFLGDNLINGVLPKKKSKKVSSYVIADNTWYWNKEPYHAFKQILDDKMWLSNRYQ